MLGLPACMAAKSIYSHLFHERSQLIAPWRPWRSMSRPTRTRLDAPDAAGKKRALALRAIAMYSRQNDRACKLSSLVFFPKDMHAV